jgi:hypothetical protein
MMKYPKARRRLHRAFLDWLAVNGERLAIPLRIIERRDREIRLGFERATPALEVSVTTWEINILVIWQGEWWDMLISFEALLKQVPGGYRCRLCLPEAQRVWPSREALWLDHLFDPFLDWVNTELVHAQRLGLYETEGGGVRWARLLGDDLPEDGEPDIEIPLWVSSKNHERAPFKL